MPTEITLSGWKEFEDKLANMPKILEAEIGGEVRYAAEEWAGLAKSTAASGVAFDTGHLAGLIDAKHIAPLQSEVTSSAEYSAFVEWGTRSRVRVPGDLQAYASQFRGKGGIGGNPKKLIYAWCERKGIPKNLWWPIFITLMTRGSNPHPFFFIQVPLVEKQLFANVKNILTTEH